MDIEGLIPLAGAAKRTSLSESSIRRGLKSGNIVGVKLGRDWLLSPQEVDRLAADHPLQFAIPKGV